MSATRSPAPRTSGIGTLTEIRLDDPRQVVLSARAGDLLRSAGGIVWATVDGEPDDILLDHGDVHLVARDCELRVSALARARLQVYGQGPLCYELPRPRMSIAARLRQALRIGTGDPAPAGPRAAGRAWSA